MMLRGLLCAIAVIAAMREARAGTGLVIVTGTAKEQDRVVVANAASTALKKATWQLVEAKLSDADLKRVDGCLALDRPWPCLVPVVPKGLDRVMVIRVDESMADRLSLFSQVVTAADGVPPTSENSCVRCDNESLALKVDEQTRGLLTRLIDKDTRVLDLTTVPAGAKVILDGQSIGTSNLVTPITQGRHSLRLELSGYAVHDSSFEVTERTTRMELPLRKDGDSGRPSLVAPAIVMATGLAAIAWGAVWYSLDEDEDPAGPQNETIDDTAKFGVGFMVGGAAVLAAGTYWYFHRRSEAKSAPTVSLTQHGASVGWAGAW